MASILQPTNHLGQWIETLQKKSRALRLPFQADPQQALTDSYTLLVDGARLPACQRFIVIVPGVGMDYYALANKLWSLASPDRREILLVGVYDHRGDEFQARRNLTSLAAATRDQSVKVQSQIVESQGLMAALRGLQQAEDILLCPEKMSLPGLVSRSSLLKALSGAGKIPLYALDLAITEDRAWLDYLRMEYALTCLALLSVIAMVGLLLWLHQVSSGGIRALLEFITILVEARILWGVANYMH